MKKFFLFMAFAALALAAISCTAMLPTRFERFVGRVEKNASSFTKEDWDKTSQSFEKLMNAYEKSYDKLSKEDRSRIDKAIGRYHAIVVKSGLNNIIKSFDRTVKGALGGIGGFFEGLGGKSEDPVE